MSEMQNTRRRAALIGLTRLLARHIEAGRPLTQIHAMMGTLIEEFSDAIEFELTGHAGEAQAPTPVREPQSLAAHDAAGAALPVAAAFPADAPAAPTSETVAPAPSTAPMQSPAKDTPVVTVRKPRTRRAKPQASHADWYIQLAGG